MRLCRGSDARHGIPWAAALRGSDGEEMPQPLEWRVGYLKGQEQRFEEF